MLRIIQFTLAFCSIAVASGIHQVTEGGPSDDYPTWSPDETKVAFDRIVGNNYDVYYKQINSTNAAIRLTNNSYTNRFPVWSPDGQIIAFYSWIPNSYGIGEFFHYIATGEEVLVVNDGGAYACWSPDGKFLAYSKTYDNDTEIVKKELDNGTVTRLTYMAGQDASPDWSPDGQSIIYEHGDTNPTLWIIPSAGGTPQQIPGIWGYRPNYSPDGTKICFDAGSFTSGVFIYIYDLTTGQLTNTHVPGMNPDWSPLGDKIAYMSAGDIYYMDYPFVQEPSTLGKMKAMYK